jgi:hypothetical protein
LAALRQLRTNLDLLAATRTMDGPALVGERAQNDSFA